MTLHSTDKILPISFKYYQLQIILQPHEVFCHTSDNAKHQALSFHSSGFLSCSCQNCPPRECDDQVALLNSEGYVVKFPVPGSKTKYNQRKTLSPSKCGMRKKAGGGASKSKTIFLQPSTASKSEYHARAPKPTSNTALTSESTCSSDKLTRIRTRAGKET